LLCELVGATRESVSLVLGRLAAEGLVERKGTNFVVAPPRHLAGRLESSPSDIEVPFAPTASAEQAIQ
jgi:DNA-binding FadR family transcriptional regulator